MAHMLEPAALASCGDTTVAAAARFINCGGLANAVKNMIVVYAYMSADRRFDDDNLKLAGFLADTMCLLMPALNELIATQDKTDPDYAEKMKSLEGMRTATAQSMSWFIDQLETIRSATPSVREAYAATVARFYPRLLSYMTTAPAFHARLVRLATTDPDPKVRAALAGYPN